VGQALTFETEPISIEMGKSFFTGLLTLFFLLTLNVPQAQDDIQKLSLQFTTGQGITLAQDVYLPPGEGPFPVVLIRTPYGKFQYEGDGRFFARRGFATVVQDVRGKFGSDGHFLPFKYETTDGLATLDWLQQQSWCNGRVGIYGISYSGFCGLTLANKNHPALRAVINFSGWVEPEKMAAPGGANHLMLNLTWLLHEETQTARNLQDYELDSLFYFLPLAGVFRSIGLESKAWEDPDLLGAVNRDFDYGKVTIPILHLTGAYDFVKEATVRAFREMEKNGKAEQSLIFGPWFHNQSHTSLTEVGEVDFGEASLYGDDKVRELAVQWLKRYLGGEKTKSPLPKARIFLMFDNRWYDFEQWPIPGIREQSYFLGSQKGANSIDGDGVLTLVLKASNDYDQFTYDPSRPVPTHGGANFHFFPAQLGIKDQSDLEEREDILVFDTPVFEQEEAVIGAPRLEFYATTSAPDTDFTAKLVLVAPDGTAMNMVDGIVRARYRKGSDQAELLTPGQVYPLEIQLGTTAFLIKKGYRLRLEVSSSNFPKYNRNTNTQEDPFYSEKMEVARQRIYHTEKYPSRLVLPMVPFEKLNER